ncbi:MAG: type II secretion system GspH family protein [Akkermansia sp.]|nr:type II secretion system GspH family protein [Akkermansia sp.]
MKQDQSFRRRRGFTLIELIVVMAILATLAVLSVAGLGMYMDKARATAANKAAKDLVQAIANFVDDHNGMFPFDTEATEPDAKGMYTLITADGKDFGMMANLTNRNGERNNKGTDYMDSDLKEEAKDGLYEKDGNLGFYDPWGKPYRVIIGAGEREGSIDPFTGKELRAKYLVYSLGADGEGDPVGADTAGKSGKSAKNVKKPKGKAAKRKAAEAAKAAAEEAKEAQEDNVYSWKK